MKIGIFGEGEALHGLYSLLKEINSTIEGAQDYRNPPHFPSALDLWAKDGVEYAFVIESSYGDPDGVLGSLTQCLRGREPGPPKVVYVARESRTEDDEGLTALIDAGAHAVLLPSAPMSAKDQIELFLDPLFTKREAMDLVSSSGAGASGSPQLEPSDRARPPRPAPAAATSPRFDPIEMMHGQTAIAVLTPIPRGGASTVSQIIARTLALIDERVALVVEERSYKAFAKVYPHALSADGNHYGISGVDVYCGATFSAVPRGYSYVVLDLGFYSWSIPLQKMREADRDKRAEFFKAQLKILYVSIGNPQELEFTSKCLQAIDSADLNTFTLGIWGCHDSLRDDFDDALRKRAPKIYSWYASYVPWPLNMNEVMPEVIDMLRPYITRATYNKYSRKPDAEAEGARQEPEAGRRGILSWLRS